MRQIRFSVAITVDYRFVLAVSFGLVSLLGTWLLLKKQQQPLVSSLTGG